MKCRVLGPALAALMSVSTVSGATRLFDFEDAAEIADHGLNSRHATLEIVDRYAASGSHALRFSCEKWQQGMMQWPSFTLHPKLQDWTGYDRLMVDVVHQGALGNILAFYAAETDGRIQNGLHSGHISLPSNGWLRICLPLDKLASRCDPRKISRLHVYTDAPGAMVTYLDNVTLLKPGEAEPPPGDGYARDLLQESIVALRAEQVRNHALQHQLDHVRSLNELLFACVRAGLDCTRMIVAQAPAAVKVRPRGARLEHVEPACGVSLGVAGNEHESVQILVSPTGEALRNVTVKPSVLRLKDGTVFPFERVKAFVTGYVEVKAQSPYKVGYSRKIDRAPYYERAVKLPEQGWWPDPLLEFQTSCDVQAGDVQSFWVRVTCPEGQRPGVYEGTLEVCAEGVRSVRVPFALRVHAFDIGKAPPLPMSITFSPIVSSEAIPDELVKERDAIRARQDAPAHIWRRHRAEWGEFLADYFIGSDSIAMEGGSYDFHPHPDFTVLDALKAEGRLDIFNLGYWHCFKDGEEAKWRAETLPRIRRAYESAKARGMLDKAYIYGCDELSPDLFASVSRALDILKAEFPGIPVMTTSRDSRYGLDGSPLAKMDWFIPSTEVYDKRQANRARKAGHKVGWYICCGPNAPYANMFIEGEAIEGRLLMGAMAVRMRPDSFLYYQTSIWNSPRPITSGPFTDWTARSFGATHGDGSWCCVGADGAPLPTQRLENFRDGVEDYAYAMLLEKKFLEGKQGEAWNRRARELLAVPESVMKSMSDFNDDPAAVMRWRDEMAKLLDCNQ